MPKPAIMLTAVTLLFALTTTRYAHCVEIGTSAQVTSPATLNPATVHGEIGHDKTDVATGAVWTTAASDCDYRIPLDAGCGEPTQWSDLDPDEVVRVESAVRLFSDQGLKLPDLTFSFHDFDRGL